VVPSELLFELLKKRRMLPSLTRGEANVPSIVGRFVAEMAFLCVLAFVAGPFWSCLKSPAHLHKLLADQGELRRIIELIGYDTLYADAEYIQPLISSYGQNIELWNKAHARSLSSALNYLGLFCLAVLAASLWMGFCYFVVSAVVLLVGMSQAPEHAEINNAKHITVLILNLVKWNQVDVEACASFCRQLHPEYFRLHQVVASLRAEVAHAS
jgi:hypothetical protein